MCYLRQAWLTISEIASTSNTFNYSMEADGSHYIRLFDNGAYCPKGSSLILHNCSVLINAFRLDEMTLPHHICHKTAQYG